MTSAHFSEIKDFVPNRSSDTDKVVRRWVGQIPSPGEYRSPSLCDGAAMYAIFLSESARYLREPSLAYRVSEHLEYGIGLFDGQPVTTSFFRSIAGFGWAVDEVNRRQSLPWAEEVSSDIDALLLESMRPLPFDTIIDVIDGTAGLMVYAVRRRHTREGKEIILLLEEWLRSRFAYWASPVDPTRFEADAPDLDLSVAHGISGLLSSFSLAARAGVLSEECVELISMGLTRLWELSGISTQGRKFIPKYAGDSRATQVAWCAGTLGATFTFLNGVDLDKQNLARAQMLADYAVAQFSEGRAGIQDACLCHGDAGAALGFSILASEAALDVSTRKLCQQVANVSLSAALDREVMNQGRSEFPAFIYQKWMSTNTLLYGGVGVGLALAAASRAERSTLAKMFLLTA